MDVLLRDVAQVPDLRHHLFTSILIKNGYVVEGNPVGVAVKLKSERSIVFQLGGILFILYGSRVNRSSGENTCAVIAPRQPPNKSAININDFHCAAGD